jgi:outer membrane protein, heavy metal efflux system
MGSNRYAKVPQVLCVSLFLMFETVCAFPQESESLALKDLIARSLKQNPSILAENKKIEAIGTTPSQAYALPDPKLSAEWMNLPASKPSIAGAWREGINVGVTQDLPYPGKRALNKQEAESMIEVEREALRGLEAKITSNIKEAYYTLQYIDRSLNILESSKVALSQGTEAAKARYSTGMGISADILKGQTAITEIENREIELNRIQKTAMDQLNSLMGLSPDSGLSIKYEQEEIPDLSTLETLLDKSKDAPAVREVRNMKEAADIKVSIAKKDFKPDFMIGGLYRFKDSTMGGKDYFTVMAGVSLPVFHRKDRYMPALEEAMLNRDSKDYELENALIETKYNLAENYRMAKQAKASYDLITGALLTQAEATLQSVSASYSVGKADFEYYMDSLLALYNYEYEAEAMKSEIFKAVARIEGILGKPITNPDENQDEKKDN